MFVPKLADCMVHLFHLNEEKFNFQSKLFGCFCFDLDPEIECRLFADKLRAIPCKNQPNPNGGSARMVLDLLHTLQIY